MHPLEKRREMNGTFPGRIVLVEGDEVDVDLQIAADKVRLATPFAEIGLWDRASIHFERNSSGGYELSVADDVVTFYPADLDAFSDAVVAEEPAGSGAPPSNVSLVPSIEEDEIDEPEAEEPEPIESSEPDDPASKFGPSSRERLAAAMSGFRQRQESQESEAGDDETLGEVEEPVQERTSSAGFVIPGDAGYSFPSEEEHTAIHFDEDVEDSTVADEVISAQRSLRGASTLGVDAAKLKKIALGVVALAVLVALGFAVPIVIDFFSGGDDTTTPTIVATTVPATEATTPTTVAPTTEPTVDEGPTVPADTSVFELEPEAFVERWNETASLVSPSLRFRSSLPAGDFEVGFTQYIAMIGTSGATPSGLSAFTLEIDPTGPSSSDRLGIQALGLAIAVADPTLEPSERGAVLGAMGLDVRDPDLEGLDGSFSRNGVDYRLVYDSEDLILRLTVSPS